jgi:hypothetical protein
MKPVSQSLSDLLHEHGANLSPCLQ